MAFPLCSGIRPVRIAQGDTVLVGSGNGIRVCLVGPDVSGRSVARGHGYRRHSLIVVLEECVMLDESGMTWLSKCYQRPIIWDQETNSEQSVR